MERKLASIQIIKDIKPIPDADKLEVASILGWKVVVKKGEFQIGQRVVYFEIDSCLPVGVPEYEFLRSSSYKNSPILGEVFRLKTVKLRGQISQGLILPIEVCFKDCMPISNLEEGEDVTEVLNIKKWEEPESANIGGDARGKRPSWIEHSSETRVQSEPKLFDEFYNVPYYITTKYDGSSHFVAIDVYDDFHFGSHNLELKPIEKPGSFYNFILEHNIEQNLRKIKEQYKANQIYIIGEWCGQGIQKNRLQLQKPYWYMFTINIDSKRLGMEDLIKISTEMGLSHVGIEEMGQCLQDKYPTIEDLLERAKQNLLNIYPGKCEGIVIRPIVPCYSETIGTDLSMKVLNNEYLLKE